MPNDQASQVEIDVTRVPAKGGPQSDLGKQSSRRNAWKHGFASESLDVPDSERAAYDAQRVQFFAEMTPQSLLQRTLVDRICRNSWKLTRIAEEEDDLISLRIALKQAAARAFENNDRDRADELAEVEAQLNQQAKLLARYEQAAERGMHKALNMFLRLRKHPELLDFVALPAPAAAPAPSYAPRREAPANVQPRILPPAPNEPQPIGLSELHAALKATRNGTSHAPIVRR